MNKVLAAAAIAAVLGCASAPSAPAASDATVAIPAMLHASAEAWNRGDLENFLDDYLDDAGTTFVGSDVSYGVSGIRERYMASYWKDGPPAQKLSFRDLRVRPLGEQHALTAGQYVLTNADGSIDRGFFSLVLVRTSAGWRIIHDHSSAAGTP